MKNFEELELFIKNNLKNNSWIDKLKKAPYNLQSIKQFELNKNWYILVYNLFSSDLSNKIVKQCRGTVVEVLPDGTVNVICAPYLKFFDINDPHADKINWDSKKLKCQTKCDGQLIKCFKYKGRDYWITNGGTGLFTPLDYETEAVKDYFDLMSAAIANADPNAVCNILTDKDNKRVDLHVVASWLDKVPDGWTLMFELTSPQNRIIVKYSDTKLWFHGARDAEGIEHSPEEVIAMFGIPFDIPKRWDLNKREDIIDALSKMNGLENEGFVVVDEENWTRVKMKSPSYLNMKFVRDNDNPEGIWRLVITEQYDDILPNAPELKEKIEAQVKQLVEFNKKLDAEIAYAIDVWDNDSKHNRKHFAEFVNNQVKPNLRKIYFSAIDGKPVAKEIKEKMINLKKGYTDIYLLIMNDLGVKAKVEW